MDLTKFENAAEVNRYIASLEAKAQARCGRCKYRDAEGYCDNEKLAENYGQNKEKRADMLIYSYTEGGGFWVGEQFGCVHWQSLPPPPNV